MTSANFQKLLPGYSGLGIPGLLLAICFGFSLQTSLAQDDLSLVLDLQPLQTHAFADAILDTDRLNGQLSLQVAPADVGKQADLYLAARYQNQWYISNGSAWLPWSGDIDELLPYSSHNLGSTVEFELFENELLGQGDYEVIAAYQPQGEAMVEAREPLVFTVQASTMDTLHRFRSDQAMEDYLKQGMAEGASSEFNRVALETFSSTDSASSGGASGESQVSVTNVQEAGVDEADTVKTDGEYLYTLRSCGFENCVVTFQLDPVVASATEVGLYQPATEINDFSSATSGMYLVTDEAQGNDRLVTLSGGFNSYIAWIDIWGWSSNEVELEFLDATDPANLVLSERMVIDGNLISSRRIGDSLFVVTRYTPSLEGFVPYAFDEQTRQSNAEVLSTASLSVLLPKVGFPEQDPADLITSKDCYIATNSLDLNRNPGIITVTTIPLSDPQAYSSTCFLGETETVYMTPDSLYLATTQYQYEVLAADALLYDPEHRTSIHKFALVDGSVSYEGSGDVPGHLGWSEDKRSFRMGAGGEKGEYLNIVTSLGSSWGDNSSTRLTVLKQVGNSLETVNHIDGIGKPGEQLFSARFVGERAYLVTFRVIDPLYVIDLSDQDNPFIAGELEIEGYSDYLHPVDENLLLGFGKDAIPDDGSSDFGFTRGAWYQGVKLSLFDVSDPSAPTEINSLVYGKRGSQAEILTDHHGIAFLPATANTPYRFSIPIQVNETVPDFEGFDPESPSAWYNFTNKGLYSFEVTSAGVVERGYIEGDATDQVDVFAPFSSIGDRAVLVDEAVFYIHNGEVLASPFGTYP